MALKKDLPQQPIQNESAVEAEFALEAEALCPHCKAPLSSIQVVRLLRTKVNFVSSLPRRGQVLVCPQCKSIIAGALGGLL